MMDKREIVNFVGLECARKAYYKRREGLIRLMLIGLFFCAVALVILL